MFDYNICNRADEDIFRKQCLAIEKNIPNLKKNSLLTDVDNSLIQEYRVDENKIQVVSDTSIDAVYVKSEIPLEPFFN